jgi:hypothetical protein
MKIFITTHINHVFPSNEYYIPIFAGAKSSALNLNLQRDDEGSNDNISEKNHTFSEYTSFYFAWKNMKHDYIGFCHYRRYFNFDATIFTSKINSVIDVNNIDIISNQNINKYYNTNFDFILPYPHIFNHSIEHDYKIHHVSEDFKILSNVIHDKYPHLYDEWMYFTKYTNKLYPYNMFITKSELFSKYCKFSFEILFECEKLISISPYYYQKRVFGFMGERLFTFFIYLNNFKLHHLPIYFISNTNNNITISNRISKIILDFRNNIFFSTINLRHKIIKLLYYKSINRI